MKRLLLLCATFVLAACASDDMLHHQDLDGSEGGPLSVDLVSFQPQYTGRSMPSEDFNERITIRVEVANLSQEDVTVRKITVRQSGGSTAYSIEPAFRGGDVLIPEGDQETFDLIASGKANRYVRPGQSAMITLTVIVSLANGDSYHYGFEVEAPIPEQGRS